MTYEERIALRNAIDRQSIVAARIAGFMDCTRCIRRAWL